MLDDVAAYLVIAPLASTLILVALAVAWLIGGRWFRPRLDGRTARIETGAAVRKRI